MVACHRIKLAMDTLDVTVYVSGSNFGKNVVREFLSLCLILDVCMCLYKVFAFGNNGNKQRNALKSFDEIRCKVSNVLVMLSTALH